MPEWTLSLNNKVIKRFNIEENSTVTIGRGSEADVVIDNPAISRQHSTLELKDGRYYITDHYSLNGTMVNGEKIEATVPLNAADTIAIGKFSLTPATETGESGSDSYSASPAINDDTIFISHKERPKASKPSADRLKHRLVAIQGEARPPELYLAGKTSIKIGKEQDCDMVVKGVFVAATQCFIVLKEDAFHIVPQKSWFSSTIINGKKIKDETPLRHGDIIETGRVKIKFD